MGRKASIETALRINVAGLDENRWATYLFSLFSPCFIRYQLTLVVLNQSQFECFSIGNFKKGYNIRDSAFFSEVIAVSALQS
jgi:hypothetical protein